MNQILLFNFNWPQNVGKVETFPNKNKRLLFSDFVSPREPTGQTPFEKEAELTEEASATLSINCYYFNKKYLLSDINKLVLQVLWHFSVCPLQKNLKKA